MSKNCKNRRDGWHTLQGLTVYIENNCVIRGIKKDRNGSEVSAYPYRKVGLHEWSNCSGISADAFISGVKRDKIIIQ